VQVLNLYLFIIKKKKILNAGITDAIVVTTPAETLKTILIHDKL